MDLDSINVYDIINSFPDENDYCLSIDNYIDIEKMYRDKYNELNYYRIIQPYEHRMELKKGITIRYSKNIDHVSCSAYILKVKYNNKTKIKSLLLKARNDKAGDVWEIDPQIYHIFVYNPTVNKFSRDIYRSGGDVFKYLTDLEDKKLEYNPFEDKELMAQLMGDTIQDDSILNNLIGNEQRYETNTNQKIDRNINDNTKNKTKTVKKPKTNVKTNIQPNSRKVIKSIEDLLEENEMNKTNEKYGNDIGSLLNEYKRRTKKKSKPKLSKEERMKKELETMLLTVLADDFE